MQKKIVLIEGLFKDKIKDKKEAEYLKSFDPSEGKYIDWITRQYLSKEESGWDTYSKYLKSFLEAFTEYSTAGLIKKNEQDISAYKTIEDLQDKLSSIEEGETNEKSDYAKYLKRKEQGEKVKEGANTVFQRVVCGNCGKYLEDEKSVLSHTCKKPAALVAKEKEEREEKFKKSEEKLKRLKAEGKVSDKELEAFYTKAKEQKGPSSTYDFEALRNLGMLKTSLLIVKLENVEATKEYCSKTTWCITNAEQFNSYKTNIGCNFYLVINYSVPTSSPCFKFMVVVFPNWYIGVMEGLEGFFSKISHSKDALIAADPEFQEKFDRFEDNLGFVKEYKDKKDKTVYAVFTAGDKLMTFKTFLEALDLEKQRNIFEIPQHQPTRNMLEAAIAEDKAYAENDSVFIREYKITEDNKIVKQDELVKRGKMEELKAVMDNIDEIGYLAELANSGDKESWLTNEILSQTDIDNMFSKEEIENYKKNKYYKVGAEDDTYNVYMAKGNFRKHINVFLLISKADPNNFLLIRYVLGEEYEHNQFREVFNYVEAVYVQKEVDDKMAYYCDED